MVCIVSTPNKGAPILKHRKPYQRSTNGHRDMRQANMLGNESIRTRPNLPFNIFRGNDLQ